MQTATRLVHGGKRPRGAGSFFLFSFFSPSLSPFFTCCLTRPRPLPLFFCFFYVFRSFWKHCFFYVLFVSSNCFWWCSISAVIIAPSEEQGLRWLHSEAKMRQSIEIGLQRTFFPRGGGCLGGKVFCTLFLMLCHSFSAALTTVSELLQQEMLTRQK